MFSRVNIAFWLISALMSLLILWNIALRNNNVKLMAEVAHYKCMEAEYAELQSKVDEKLCLPRIAELDKEFGNV